MKNIIFKITLLLLISLPEITNAQYIEGSRLSNQIKIDTLIDTLTGRKFILDKERIYITAINRRGKVIWRTDPVIDSKIKPYRHARPIIVYFAFSKDTKEIINISYSNSMFGVLKKENGKFYFSVRD